MNAIKSYTAKNNRSDTALCEESALNHSQKNLKVIPEGIPVKDDKLKYTKKGNKYQAHCIIQPVTDETGHLIKFFSMRPDVIEQKRMEEEIVHQKVERQKEKTRATIQGQEKERNEVGLELHDNIQQILAAAKLHLECSLKMGPDALQFIRRGLDNVKLAIDEIRSFSKHLVAPRFNESKLTDEIKMQLSNLGISAMVLLDTDSLDEEALPDDIKLVIFRVIQEQLTNIIKHAKASSVTIQLANDKQNITLAITDNGVGFDPALKKNGIGLNNIHNRVELFDGTAKIISAQGKGCKVVVRIPLKIKIKAPFNSKSAFRPVENLPAKKITVAEK